MELIVDTANIKAIKEAYENYVIDGVTTNPSIIKKSNRNPYEVLKEIRNFIGENANLHVQVVSTEYDEIIKEAERITKELGKNTYVKIPVTKVGIKAIKDLSKDGYNITATAIYTNTQAFMAAKCGAKYVAPYINRIDNLGNNGLKIAKEIHEILRLNNLPTKVLAASFKNCFQAMELIEYGLDALTIDPSIIDNMIKVDSATQAVNDFKDDFESLCGEGKNMSNI